MEPAQKKEAPSDLLDVADVATKLNVSPTGVRRLAAKGLIPAPYRLGKLLRWSRRSIDEFIDGVAKVNRSTPSK